MLQNMSSVTLHSKASMPQSAPPSHWTVSLLWCPAGFGGQQAVCVVPSGLCRTFSQFKSFLLHFLLPESLLNHLFPVFTRLSVNE